MDKVHLHVKYCSDIMELERLLDKINPEEFVQMTKDAGYIVIWKSDREFDFR